MKNATSQQCLQALRYRREAGSSACNNGSWGCGRGPYLRAGELEVGVIRSPQRGARFTVYQPGFVITSREVMRSLWNGKPREGGEAGVSEKKKMEQKSKLE